MIFRNREDDSGVCFRWFGGFTRTKFMGL